MKQSWIVKGYQFAMNTTSPGVSDTGFPISFIWINIAKDIAYILNSVVNGVATWFIKNPDCILNEGVGQINVIGETALGEAIKSPGVTVIPTTGIFSSPGAGEHRVTNIRVGPDNKMIATFDETPA